MESSKGNIQVFMLKHRGVAFKLAVPTHIFAALKADSVAKNKYGETLFQKFLRNTMVGSVGPNVGLCRDLVKAGLWSTSNGGQFVEAEPQAIERSAETTQVRSAFVASKSRVLLDVTNLQGAEQLPNAVGTANASEQEVEPPEPSSISYQEVQGAEELTHPVGDANATEREVEPPEPCSISYQEVQGAEELTYPVGDANATEREVEPPEPCSISYQEGSSLTDRRDSTTDETAAKSATVLVKNLPPSLEPSELEDFINLKMHVLGLASKGGLPVVDVRVDCDEDTALVVFRDPIETEASLALNGIAWKKKLLRFSLHADAPSSRTQHKNDEEWTTCFIKNLLISRSPFMVSRSRNKVYKEIAMSMSREKHFVTVEELKTKFKGITQYYENLRDNQSEKRCRQWKHYYALSRFFGDDVDPDVEDILWTRNATLALIDAYGQRAEKFRAGHKPKPLWDQVTIELKSFYEFKWTQCRGKWNRLVSEYNTIVDQLDRSGSGGHHRNWDYWDAMSLVMGEVADVQPSLTVGVGAALSIKRKNNDNPKAAKYSRKENATATEERRLTPAQKRKKDKEEKDILQLKVLQALLKKLEK